MCTHGKGDERKPKLIRKNIYGRGQQKYPVKMYTQYVMHIQLYVSPHVHRSIITVRRPSGQKNAR